MPILDVERLLGYAVPQAHDLYDPRDAILYALGTGAGLSPDIDELDMVFERNLKVLPTMALVLGTPGFWLMDPAVGLDWPRILHGEQSLVLHRPLDPQDELIGSTRIGEIADKGPGKSALFRAYRTLKDLGGNTVAELSELWVLREAGGFGGERNLSGPPPVTMPNGPAPFSLALPTSRQQALIYRLSGDRNPLHVHADTAKQGGFDRPILHGLSTLGLACRALAHLHCGGDPTILSSIAARFTAPVFPGDTVRTESWRDGNEIVFRAIAQERNVVVIDGGTASVDRFVGRLEGESS
ncbi:MaoC/PaaZ C-terminal domain-containing protein [Novosphingobium sp. CCH12-A3]|uniref:MaoC/PaaZ C-terminal domain-containing protein n=1 Tax=Novosphingobium sp. CCH12-A3 TaxID=1768752 RepID=UPI000A47F10F|nr:MaoC/PaaZ C-terminal domain-containing protein [Novosphingobium sp. CCH12-A3]